MDNIKENQVALFTMCSDNLVDVGLTMIYSFLFNNEWFYECGIINIICDNNICKLSSNGCYIPVNLLTEEGTNEGNVEVLLHEDCILRFTSIV